MFLKQKVKDFLFPKHMFSSAESPTPGRLLANRAQVSRLRICPEKKKKTTRAGGAWVATVAA